MLLSFILLCCMSFMNTQLFCAADAKSSVDALVDDLLKIAKRDNERMARGEISNNDCDNNLFDTLIAHCEKNVQPQQAYQAPAKPTSADPLLTAIEKNNIPDVKKLLKTTRPNISHMSRAAKMSLDIVQLLVERDAPLDTLDDEKITPLGRAALAGNEKVVEYLCQKGARTDFRMRSNSTPLHAAALSNCPIVTKWLLDYGADPTAQDNNGKTPLHKALEKKHLITTGLLIGTGKALDVRDNTGRSPIDYAKEFLPAAVSVIQEKLDALSSARNN